MGTVIQSTQRGHEEHHQRWERIERTELCARYGDLHAQGSLSAKPPRGWTCPAVPLQAWLAYQENPG